MATIQSITETFASKDDASGRSYLSAASIMAQCREKNIDNDTMKEYLDTFNKFVANLRNRTYDTKPLPSGNAHEHIYARLSNENYNLRLRIEPKISASTGNPYTHKLLIILPLEESLGSIDVTKIRTISRSTNPSIEDTRTNEERQYDHEEAISKQEAEVSF